MISVKWNVGQATYQAFQIINDVLKFQLAFNAPN